MSFSRTQTNKCFFISIPAHSTFNSSIVLGMGNLFILLTFSVSLWFYLGELFHRRISAKKVNESVNNLFIDPLTSAAEAKRRILITLRKSIMNHYYYGVPLNENAIEFIGPSDDFFLAIFEWVRVKHRFLRNLMRCEI